MLKQKQPLDRVFHQPLIPLSVPVWQLLVADNAYRRHLLVGFAGISGYLLSEPDQDNCCLFASSANGREQRVPVAALLLVRHASDVFVEDVKKITMV